MFSSFSGMEQIFYVQYLYYSGVDTLKGTACDTNQLELGSIFEHYEYKLVKP